MRRDLRRQQDEKMNNEMHANPPLSIWYDGTAACGPVNPVR